MEALMQHYQTEHMKVFMDALPEVVSGEINTRRFAVQTMEATANEPEENYVSKSEAPRIVH
jgi:quinol monooxygenase YgiN